MRKRGAGSAGDLGKPGSPEGLAHRYSRPGCSPASGLNKRNFRGRTTLTEKRQSRKLRSRAKPGEISRPAQLEISRTR